MSSSSTAVQLILDQTAMSFSPSNLWTSETSRLWYGNSSGWASGTNQTSKGSFKVDFQGTDIAFFGNTPPTLYSQTFNVDIDGTSYQMNYPEPGTNCQWYTSFALDDSIHTIELSGMVQIDIDYAVVTVGSSTPMQGSTIIVDDLNEEITWNGQWAERRGIAYVTGLDDGRPFGNGTKESSNIGDSMEFTFAGTSIALYGVFSWKASGFITAKFTITDFPSNSTSYSEEKSFFSPSNAPDLLNSTNFLFFDHDSLTATNHTLTVMITGVSGNQSLILDYLTYQPSFGSLSAKPDFRSSSSSGLGAGSGSVPPNVGNDSSSAGEHSSHAGAIAGGVVGGVAAVALIVAFLFWRYRRSTPKQIKQVEFGDNLIGDDIDNEPSRYFDSVIHHSPDGATILPPLLPTTTRHDSSRSFKRSDSPYTSATGSTSLPYGASFSKLATPNDMLLDQRNAELKALNGQITEMQERMVAHSSDPVISSPTQTALTDQIKLLQERIEALMRENETLGGYDNSGPPTVYMYEAFGESTVVPGSSVGERSPVT